MGSMRMSPKSSGLANREITSRYQLGLVTT